MQAALGVVAKLSSEDLSLLGLGGWMEGICTPGMYVRAWEFGGSDGFYILIVAKVIRF